MLTAVVLVPGDELRDNNSVHGSLAMRYVD
jgi:hypothetical protein